MPSLRFKAGLLIGGKYRLEERLGEGAVGIVYRAVHVGLEKSFAIKLLKTSGPPAPGALERFAREAVALGRLRHPNIVDVTDSGVDEAAGGIPYIVTEFLKGVPLSDLCHYQGPLALAQALPLLSQIAAAVDAAHAAGVLHRDLKPGNVFVCSKSLASPPIVKVLDFGLAELLAGPDQSRSDGGANSLGFTATGSLLGTPLYVAPELIQLGHASRSSDIYSFGVLTYEVLAGRPPFSGTLKEVLAGHLDVEPPALPLHPEVWRALRETLQKDPALRPGTAGEVVRRFQGVEAERAYRRSFDVPHRVQRTREQPRESRGSVLLTAAILFFCVALIGAMGFMMGRRALPTGDKDVAENKDVSKNKDFRPGRPVEAQEPTLPLVEPERRPTKPPSSTVPASPGVTLGFNDIEQTCGDLSFHPNYLCLLNRGSEQIAGGGRLVLDETLASFTIRANHGNGISISVEGKERYSLDFGPPQGKALIPGLYTNAMRWPLNQGPYPGIDASIGSKGCNAEEGQFRILQILLAGDKVQQFVADFETSCNEAIGRIAVGQPRHPAE